MGFLAAWLRKGEDLPSKKDRWSVENRPTFQERRAARDALKDLACADVGGLFVAGADKKYSKPSEPEYVE